MFILFFVFVYITFKVISSTDALPTSLLFCFAALSASKRTSQTRWHVLRYSHQSRRKIFSCAQSHPGRLQSVFSSKQLRLPQYFLSLSNKPAPSNLSVYIFSHGIQGLCNKFREVPCFVDPEENLSTCSLYVLRPIHSTIDRGRSILLTRLWLLTTTDYISIGKLTFYYEELIKKIKLWKIVLFPSL